MSIKTYFKRIALAVLVSVGLGFLPAPSALAVVANHSVTLSSSTASVTVGDTATVTLTHSFTHTLDAVESATVRYTCSAPSGATCPTVYGFQSPTADTANVTLKRDGAIDGWLDLKSGTSNHGAYTTAVKGWTDSSTAVSTDAVRSTVSIKAVNFDAAGTYTYTFYSTSGTGGTSGTSTAGVTWTVTATGADRTATQVLRKYVSTDMFTAKTNYLNQAPASDSAIVASAGTASSPTAVGYMFITLANVTGDTAVLIAGVRRTVDESVTVTVSGPGLVDEEDASASSTAAKSATLNVIGGTTQNAKETLTIYSDGTPGTMTITFSKGSATLGTQTITFVGAGASAGINIVDTYTSLTNASTTLRAQIKDAGGNLVQSGTYYVFASDTNIISGGAAPVSTIATSYQSGHACSTWNTTTKVLSCTLTVGSGTNGLETGTATVVLRDSWTVAGSSFVSNEVTMTISSDKTKAVTVAFDKSTYRPGEAAVITITTKDIADRNFGTVSGGFSMFSKVLATPSLTYSADLPGTAGVSPSASQLLKFTNLNDGATETRVVLMPSYGGDVTYEVTYTAWGALSTTTVSAKASVVDPSQTAQNTAIANAQAAADAATDAALQAIDAANAATDAANLAAEAADAATVAAQESKDSADAATAAVESLATQVATLMAALQAQITSLANVVAKIAKKVKA